MKNIINKAAGLIRKFDPALAQAWVDQPFRRVDLATAFARGFANDECDDVNPTADLVLQISFWDRDMRQADAALQQ